MTLNISVPNSTQELSPKITVIGVGGAGSNAVNNMISAKLEGVDFLVANTDGQALANSLAERKIQLGRTQTQGLGAGSKPELGRIAAEESIDDILAELADSHMVFITAGMGGGTGTGAAPVIARACRERGILTVGVITKPFDFEGLLRMQQANQGIEELQAYVDTLIIIPNQNLFRLANERTTFADAFAMADQVLHQGVCGITDLMIKPGTINLDFADIRSVMAEMGKAMMGTGEASGENRASNAAEAAINNPLLDDTSMKGAQAVLINITGGVDMTLFEVDEAANYIRREVDPEAIIIFGSALDDKLDGIMRVSVVATGIDAGAKARTVSQTQTPLQATTRAGITPTPEKAGPEKAGPEKAGPEKAGPEKTGPQAPVSGAPVSKTPVSVAPVSGAPVSGAPASGTPASGTPATIVEGNFALSSEPPVAEVSSTDTANETDKGEYFNDDPNQHNLMDMVSASEEDNPEKEAFIPQETAEPEEVTQPEKQIGLIKHISNIMFTGKPSAKEEQAEAGAETQAEAQPSDESQPSNESLPSDASQSSDSSQPSEPSLTAAKPQQAVSSPATLSPVTPSPASNGATDGATAIETKVEEQLEIEPPAEDIDLEIPAFLRRQAN